MSFTTDFLALPVARQFMAGMVHLHENQGMAATHRYVEDNALDEWTHGEVASTLMVIPADVDWEEVGRELGREVTRLVESVP